MNGSGLESLRYRLTEVAQFGDHIGYPAILRREPRAVRWLRYMVLRRDRWLVDPLMPKTSVDALFDDLNRLEPVDGIEPLRARWDGDELVLVDTGHVVDPRYPRPSELRLRPDRRGLYPISGGVDQVGSYGWEWLEVIPPWPGDSVDAATIVSLLEAPPHTRPIRTFITARAGIAEIVRAFDLTDKPETLMGLCDVVHDRRLRSQHSDDGRSDTAAAAPALLAILDHESGGVRSYAADTLSGISAGRSDAVLAVAPDATARILDHIRSQSDGSDAHLDYLDLLLNALDYLGALDDDDAIPDLIEFLGHNSSWVRARAATSLGNLRASAAAPTLKQALESETESHTREAMADALRALEATN